MPGLRESLAKVIKKDVDEALRIYPKTLKNFILSDTNGVVSISTPLLEELGLPIDANLSTIKNNRLISNSFNKQLANMSQTKRPVIAGVLSLSKIKGIKAAVITINERVGSKGPFEKKYTDDMQVLDNYNEAMARLIVKGGSTSKSDSLEKQHQAECAVMAYKALRHKQRFGNETSFTEANSTLKSVMLGFRSPAFITDGIIQKVEEIAEDKYFDLKTLTYAETVQLAGDIAEKYKLDKETLHQMTKSYDDPALKAVVDRFPRKMNDSYDAENVREVVSSFNKAFLKKMKNPYEILPVIYHCNKATKRDVKDFQNLFSQYKENKAKLAELVEGKCEQKNSKALELVAEECYRIMTRSEKRHNIYRIGKHFLSNNKALGIEDKKYKSIKLINTLSGDRDFKKKHMKYVEDKYEISELFFKGVEQKWLFKPITAKTIKASIAKARAKKNSTGFLDGLFNSKAKKKVTATLSASSKTKAVVPKTAASKKKPLRQPGK